MLFSNTFQLYCWKLDIAFNHNYCDFNNVSINCAALNDTLYSWSPGVCAMYPHNKTPKTTYIPPFPKQHDPCSIQATGELDICCTVMVWLGLDRKSTKFRKTLWFGLKYLCDFFNKCTYITAFTWHFLTTFIIWTDDFWFYTWHEQWSPGWNSCACLTQPSTPSFLRTFRPKTCPP